MPPAKTLPPGETMNVSPVASPTHTGGKGILLAIILAVVLVTICWPALAEPSPPPGGGFGQFNQGVPVYWPYHVVLMSAGFVLLLVGFFIARVRKTGTWYKTHMILEVAGCACIITALFIGVFMVSLSGLPHLRNLHELLGVAIGILISMTITIGYFIKRANRSKTIIRMSHRWLGRISIVLIAINIVLGLLILSVILQR